MYILDNINLLKNKKKIDFLIFPRIQKKIN